MKVLSATPGERKLVIAERGIWIGVSECCDREYLEVLLFLESVHGALIVRKVGIHIFCTNSHMDRVCDKSLEGSHLVLVVKIGNLKYLDTRADAEEDALPLRGEPSRKHSLHFRATPGPFGPISTLFDSVSLSCILLSTDSSIFVLVCGRHLQGEPHVFGG